MTSNRPKYWFPAKRYGWGWGLPVTWQGWVALILWGATLFLGRRYLPHENIYAQIAFALATAGLLGSICLKTGEPPRWRLGHRD
jgi:hypothetical protein